MNRTRLGPFSRPRAARRRESSLRLCDDVRSAAGFRRFSDALPLQRLLSTSQVFRQSEAKMKAVIKSPPIMGGIILPRRHSVGPKSSARGRARKERTQSRFEGRAADISDFYRDRTLRAAARKYAVERTDLSPY